MIITVTATLTPEQIDILAKQKGYQDTITTSNALLTNPPQFEQVPNPQSKEDFIREVYEGIILNDATREYVNCSNKQKEAQRIAEENAIREQVASSITSSIA